MTVYAMPVMVVVLGILAIAYRYYSAFLAARVAVLDDSRITPAHRFNDGQNFDPTNRWVLFGHHFAAISGAGPLIGPVLAIQFGYLPGLVWLVVGVCLAGAVQDMMVLAASTRRDGLSLAGAGTHRDRPAGGPGGGDRDPLHRDHRAGRAGDRGREGPGRRAGADEGRDGARSIPRSATLEREYVAGQPAHLQDSRRARPIDSATKPEESMVFHEAFDLAVPRERAAQDRSDRARAWCFPPTRSGWCRAARGARSRSPARFRLRSSSAGTCTGCDAGKILEASLIGAALVLAATVAGVLIPGSKLEPYFSLSRDWTVFALAGYGFVAAVLPVWLLLCPRDYLSTFLKIGTILLLVGGVLIVNPKLKRRPSAPISPREAAPISTGRFFRMSSSASCAGRSPDSMRWSLRERRPRWSIARATCG